MGVAGERPSPTAGPPGGVWRGRGLPPEPALTHPAQLPKTPWEHRGEAQNREPEAGKRGRKEIARTRWPLEDPQAGHYWDSGQWPLGLQPETLSGLHLTGSAPQTVRLFRCRSQGPGHPHFQPAGCKLGAPETLFFD